MAINDPSAPHPVTFGLIVPLATKVQFRSELRDALNGAGLQEVRRILGGDDVLLAQLSLSPDGSTLDANGLSTHLTDEEWDYLKTANTYVSPATRALVHFSQLQSASRPASPDFWTWAASLGYFPFVEPEP